MVRRLLFATALVSISCASARLECYGRNDALRGQRASCTDFQMCATTLGGEPITSCTCFEEAANMHARLRGDRIDALVVQIHASVSPSTASGEACAHDPACDVRVIETEVLLRGDLELASLPIGASKRALLALHRIETGHPLTHLDPFSIVWRPPNVSVTGGVWESAKIDWLRDDEVWIAVTVRRAANALDVTLEGPRVLVSGTCESK
jgi:hypothetical protein